VLILSVS